MEPPRQEEVQAETSSNPSARQVRSLPLGARVAAWIAFVLIRVWSRTLRFRMESEDAHNIRDIAEPMILVLWHNRLFVTTEIHHRFRSQREITALVSASKDGAWLSYVLKLCGMNSVRGSSSRRGGVAATLLRRKLSLDSDIAITPDGPRGPCYKMTPSPVRLALDAAVPVMLYSFNPTCGFRLKSWDRFWIPLPFSRIEIRSRRLERIQDLAPAGITKENEVSALQDALQAALMELVEDDSAATRMRLARQRNA